MLERLGEELFAHMPYLHTFGKDYAEQLFWLQKWQAHAPVLRRVAFTNDFAQVRVGEKGWEMSLDLTRRLSNEPGHNPQPIPSGMDVHMSDVEMAVRRICSGPYTRGVAVSIHPKKSKRQTRMSWYRTTSLGWHLSGPLIILHSRQISPRIGV